tara:strand:+ start:177 stop:512 length:336 start_codon:yes stop_codon:yes gene_type:complete
MRIFNFNIFTDVGDQATSASDRSELDKQTTIALSELLATNKKAAGKITLEDHIARKAGFNVSLDAALESTDPISFDSTVSRDVNKLSGNSGNLSHEVIVHYLAITNKAFEG